MLGFLQDTWTSIAATIDYAIDLGSTFAQFKILTPYPGTPMFKQLDPLLTETDWEKFDGYTPTFKHPNLTAHELKYLLGTAYKRYYMRPSYLANFLKIQNASVRDWVTPDGRARQGTSFTGGNRRHRSLGCMLTAISRYGARVLPNTEEIVAGCKARGEFIQGPQIAQFEAAFARRAGMEPSQAITASYGRMAFYYILKALDFPPGSEIVFPALTFWVMPAHCEGRRAEGRLCGRRSCDIHDGSRRTRARDHAGDARRRADPPLRPPVRHGRASSASRRDTTSASSKTARTRWARHTMAVQSGRLGDAAIFSFQTLKPLNLYGGGLALVRDPEMAARVRKLGVRGAMA